MSALPERAFARGDDGGDLCSGAGCDQKDTPRGAHLAILEPGAQRRLDGREGLCAGLRVSFPQRLAEPADPDAGQGGLGYPVLTHYNMIGVRLDSDRIESSRAEYGPDPAGIGQGKRPGFFGARHRRQRPGDFRHRRTRDEHPLIVEDALPAGE